MVERSKWTEVIKNFHESELPVLIEREADIPIELPIVRAVSLIGPRRSGKTYEMFLLIRKLLGKVEKKRILYVNLERADLGPMGYKELMTMMDCFYELYPENWGKRIWLFLDEIQNVSGWEKFARTAIDNKISVYLSGSSSKLLSSEIATSMRGRSLTYTILPFSFREYLNAKNITVSRGLSSREKLMMLNSLADYMEYGGYPEAVLYERERGRILSEVVDVTIYRDVIERSGIRNTTAMKLLIDALLNSKEFSVNKFYNFLKSSGRRAGKNALYGYIKHLNDAFFVFMLRKFSYSYKEAEQSIPKPYFVDNGLMRVRGITDKGRLMENLVFIELMRRGLELAYYRAPNGGEVDFLVKDGRRVLQLVQVSYDLSRQETEDREIRSLLKASRDLRCNDLIVINWEREAEKVMKYHGIKRNIRFVPLWKWLLCG